MSASDTSPFAASLTDEERAALVGSPSPLPDSPWNFDGAVLSDDDLVAVGADLEPSTLITAYRSGLFPMPIGRGRLGWFSPVRRAIVPLDGFHVSRSLARSRRRFELSVDRNFVGVMEGCADPRRKHGWIDASIMAAYGRLHSLGWAHSIEVWERGELVGGVYGVRVGGFFAGESMFHRSTDASKVALAGLVDLLRANGLVLFDVQWLTPHLASLGAVEVDRGRYLELLSEAVNTVPSRQTE